MMIIGTFNQSNAPNHTLTKKLACQKNHLLKSIIGVRSSCFLCETKELIPNNIRGSKIKIISNVKVSRGVLKNTNARTNLSLSQFLF